MKRIILETVNLLSMIGQSYKRFHAWVVLKKIMCKHQVQNQKMKYLPWL